VQEVAVPVGDPRMDRGDPASGLGPVVRALRLARQLPLHLGKPGPVLALMPGLVTFSPVDRVNREVIPASMPIAAVAAGAGSRSAAGAGRVRLEAGRPGAEARAHTWPVRPVRRCRRTVAT